jgi:hypothetical protein
MPELTIALRSGQILAIVQTRHRLSPGMVLFETIENQSEAQKDSPQSLRHSAVEKGEVRHLKPSIRRVNLQVISLKAKSYKFISL